MLTREDILLLLDRLSQQVVVGPSAAFPYSISQRAAGYSPDTRVALVQHKLSAMLEAVSRK